MRKRILRRGAILALVLVLLLDAMRVYAGTTKEGELEADITVSTYEELMRALDEQKGGTVIGITDTIEIPPKTELSRQRKSFYIIRMDHEAQLIFTSHDVIEDSSRVYNIVFDGKAGGITGVGGTKPFIEIHHTVSFEYCEFNNSINQAGEGGNIYIAQGDCTFKYCKFSTNSANNGSHIYATGGGAINIEGCKFTNGWANDKGGGLYLDCTTYMKDCTVTENHAREGGGIYSTNFLDIENTLIYKNEVTIQGADIVNEGFAGMNIRDNKEVYDKLLKKEGLYFTEWIDDTNPKYGGAGKYLKFGVTDEPPVEPTVPTVPEEKEPDPSQPEMTDSTTPSEEDKKEDVDPPDITDPTSPEETIPPVEDEEENTDKSTEKSSGADTENEQKATEPSSEAPPSDIEEESPADPAEDDGHEGQEEQEGQKEQKATEIPITPNDENRQEPTEQGGEPVATPSDADPVIGGDTDNSSHTDNSGSNNTRSTDNSSNRSERSQDNSTHSSDNSSSYREDNSYRDNSSSTVNNYYQTQEAGSQESLTAPTGASQPINITVPVEVSATQPEKAPTAFTGAPEGASGEMTTQPLQASTGSLQQNIKIEAEGVDLVYEYGESGVNIAIKASGEPESMDPAVTPLGAYRMPTGAQESSEKSPNWVEVVSMVLLALLVLGELKDKLKKEG